MQTKRETTGRRQYAAAVSQSADRLPPQALDYERTVLGSMLIDSAAADIAIEHLTEECFYSGAHVKIFSCIRELSEKNSPVNITTVSEKLRQKEWFEEVGADAYIAELAENVVTSGNIQYYATVIKEKSTLRRLITAAGEITTDCFSSEMEPKEVLDAAEAKIFGIAESQIKNDFESTGSLLPRAFELIDSYKKGGTIGVPTGFTKLDDLTTGLHGGDLVIVGGRPAMGKTSFCLAIALNAAIRAGHSTAIFSLEMSKDQLVQRMLSAEARINMHSLRSGTLSKDDYGKLRDIAGPQLHKAPLFIDDTPGINVLEIRAKARRLKNQHNLGLIIVDYLQLMSPHVKAESTQQAVSQISRALKGVARELNVPLIALSQLSHAVEQRTGDHRPQLSDLRESGAIEQDADLVMFVFREEVYKKDDPTLENRAEIIVGKQRNGPVGKIDVAFIKKYAGFENLAEIPEGFQ